MILGASGPLEEVQARAERAAELRDWESRVERYWHRVRNDDGQPVAWRRSLCDDRTEGHVHPRDDHLSWDIAECKGRPQSYAQAFRPPLAPDALEAMRPQPHPDDPRGSLIAPDGGPISRVTIYPRARRRRRRR